MLTNEDRFKLIRLGVKPSVIDELVNSKNSIEECIDEIIDRCSKGDMVSKFIEKKIKEGFSLKYIRENIKLLSV